MHPTTPSRRSPLLRVLMLGTLIAASYGCTGGLSCGGGSGCLSAYDFPQTAAQVPNGDAFVDDGVRMRMTQNALDFIVANIRPILAGALGSDPNNPNLVITNATEQDIGGGFAINSAVGVGGSETRPLQLVIDGQVLADNLQVSFVGANPSQPDGIHIVANGVPIGIDARVFFARNLGFTATAACDLFGTNGGLGGRPFFTTLSLDADILPSVGQGTAGGCVANAPECIRISVQVNSASIGAFGASDLEMAEPPLCPNIVCSSNPFATCHDGTSDGDGPCSEECSDPVSAFDNGGDTECQAFCAIGSFFTDIAAGLAGFINDILGQFLPALLQAAIQNALSGVDGSPLAASGRLPLATFAPGVLPVNALDLGFALGPTSGAFDVNAPDPTPGAQGMDLIMKSGFEAAPSLVDDTPVPNPCVRHIEGNDFAGLYGGFDFEAPDAQPLTGVFNGQVYAIGASLAAASLNQMAFAAYNSGALCIEASSDSVHKLTKGAFPLSVGTIDTLAGGGVLRQYAPDDAPVLIAMAPSQPPIITYGAGTDTDGDIHVNWPGVEISFYMLMNERFSRVFAVATDIDLQLSVFNDPATNQLKIAVVDGPNVGNFQQHYNELAPGIDFGSILQSLVGTVLQGALGGNNLAFNFDIGPLLSNALGGAPIFVTFDGIETTPVDDREFLNVYLGLSDTAGQPQVARVNNLRLAADPGVLRMPEAEATLHAIPTGQVRLETDDAALNSEREYFALVDFGLWHGPIRPSPDGTVLVRDEKLRFVGEHKITLRARTVGEPNSLEPEDGAQTVSVWVDGDAPRVSVKQLGENVVAHGYDLGTPLESLAWQWQIDDGAWSAPSNVSSRSVTELNGRRVAVRAIDAAGNVSKASGLDLAMAKQRVDEEAKSHFSSCSSVGVDGAWLGALVVSALALVRRRRRR